MNPRRMAAALAAASLWSLSSISSPALASQHQMKVVEVFPGTAGMPNAQYVVLQMYAPGQNFVGGHDVFVYDANDALLGTDTFAATLPIGANQTKILIATADAVTLFGVSADLILTTALPLAGGAVCFENFDCLSWGSFVDGPGGATGTGSPFAPAVGLTQGQALVCDITGGSSAILLDVLDCEDTAATHDCGDANPENNAGSTASLAANPPCPVCGNNLTEPSGGEVCDGTDDLACPLECQLDCTCLLDQAILGKLLLVKDPEPGVDATRRKLVLKAKEAASPNFLTGDPITGGASLTIDLVGTTPSSQTFTLPGGATFWSPVGTFGFKYKDRTGVNGPIKLLIVKRSNGGVFTIKATGKASIANPIALVPPNTGTDASVLLTLGPLSDKYCTAFGGAAGGTLNPNTATQLKAKNPTAEPAACP